MNGIANKQMICHIHTIPQLCQIVEDRKKFKYYPFTKPEDVSDLLYSLGIKKTTIFNDGYLIVSFNDDEIRLSNSNGALTEFSSSLRLAIKYLRSIELKEIEILSSTSAEFRFS